MPVQHLAINEIGDVSIVRFSDRILDESNVLEVGRELFELLDQDGRKNLLLNFSDVTFLSSSALGKLITLHRKVKAVGGSLHFSNICPNIHSINFSLTRLDQLFEIHEDEPDALAAFAETQGAAEE